MQNIAKFCDDPEWPSWSFAYCKPLQMEFFIQLCSSWQDFSWL